jgi:hypothetical protein
MRSEIATRDTETGECLAYLSLACSKVEKSLYSLSFRYKPFVLLGGYGWYTRQIKRVPYVQEAEDQSEHYQPLCRDNLLIFLV